jgi:hypothetical protein
VHPSMKMTGRINRCWVPPTSETNNPRQTTEDRRGVPVANRTGEADRPAGASLAWREAQTTTPHRPTGRATGPSNGELTVAASDRKRRGDYRARY